MTTTIGDRHKYSTSRRCCQTKKLQRHGTHLANPLRCNTKNPLCRTLSVTKSACGNIRSPEPEQPREIQYLTVVKWGGGQGWQHSSIKQASAQRGYPNIYCHFQAIIFQYGIQKSISAFHRSYFLSPPLSGKHIKLTYLNAYCR